MKSVMPVRRALGIRTIFHIVGPLSNPAGASAQVMGVYAPHLVPLAAQAMALLNTRHAFVVHGETGNAQGSARSPQGLDEFSISGPSHYAEVHNGIVTQHTITPEELGLTRAPIETLQGGNAQTNAHILTAIFAGEPGPPPGHRPSQRRRSPRHRRPRPQPTHRHNPRSPNHRLRRSHQTGSQSLSPETLSLLAPVSGAPSSNEQPTTNNQQPRNPQPNP